MLLSVSSLRVPRGRCINRRIPSPLHQAIVVQSVYTETFLVAHIIASMRIIELLNNKFAYLKKLISCSVNYIYTNQ